jgi:hypothetical protein
LKYKKLKYGINFDPQTKHFTLGSTPWKCEKCDLRFTGFEYLREHKQQILAY